MSDPCALGRKTCQWPSGKRFCVQHVDFWLEGLRLAWAINRPVQLKDGRWVAARRAHNPKVSGASPLPATKLTRTVCPACGHTGPPAHLTLFLPASRETLEDLGVAIPARLGDQHTFLTQRCAEGVRFFLDIES